MTCTEFLEILDDVLDESIAVETRTEIEIHLRQCGHCEVVMNTTRKTIEIFQCNEVYELPTGSERAPAQRDHGEVQESEITAFTSRFPSDPRLAASVRILEDQVDRQATL